MSKSAWAYFSNYAVYSSMFVFALAFFTNAFALAWKSTKGEKAAIVFLYFSPYSSSIFFKQLVYLIKFRIYFICGKSNWHTKKC